MTTIKGCIIRGLTTRRRIKRAQIYTFALRASRRARTNSCHKTAALINDVTESLVHGKSNYLMSAHDVPIKLHPAGFHRIIRRRLRCMQPPPPLSN